MYTNNNSFYGGGYNNANNNNNNNNNIPTTGGYGNPMMVSKSPFYSSTSSPSPSFGTSTMNTASLEQQQAQRTRQLQGDSVLKRFQNSKIISPNDNNVIDIPITLKNGQQLTFRVLMQQTFPQQPPLITTLATIKHPNIDANGYVVHQQLRQWTPQSSLGDVLALVVRDFIVNPPLTVSLDEYPKNHITKTTLSFNGTVTSGNVSGTITPPPYAQPSTYILYILSYNTTTTT